MELTQQQQIIIAIVGLASIIVLVLIRYYSQRLKQVDLDQKKISDQNNELTTQLALTQQSLTQFESQHQESKSTISEVERHNHELQQSLHNSEKVNQALKMELQKEQEMSAQKLQQFEENRKQLKVEFENLANDILKTSQKQFSQQSRDGLDLFTKRV